MLASLVASCSHAPAPPERDDARALPVLVATPIEPHDLPPNAASTDETFRIDAWVLPRDRWPTDRRRFASERDAERAARSWLQAHYELPAAFDAVFEASVRDDAFWTQRHGGIDTSLHGHLFFVDHQVVRKYGAPRTLHAEPGSDRAIVTAEGAIEAWRQVAANHQLTFEELAVRESVTLLDEPKLEFVTSLRTQHDDGTRLLRPAWLLDHAGKLGVDAHTGEPWFEDDTTTLPTAPVAPPPPLEDLTTGPAMPRLRAAPRAPIADVDAFVHEYGSFRFRDRSAADHETQPHATDELACAAARAWLVEHFGELQPGASLVVTSVQPSASGDDAPLDERDRGHTIVFEQTHRQRSTNMHTVVWLRGERVESARVELVDFTPVEGSERATLTAAGATALLRHAMQLSGSPLDELDERIAQCEPRLVYRWVDERDGVSTFRPQWQVLPGVSLLVDAHSGRVWRDD